MAAVLTCFGVAAYAQASKSAAHTAMKTRLAFVTNNPSGYRTICRKETEAAEELGTVAVEFVMPADGTAVGQTQDVSSGCVLLSQAAWWQKGAR